MAVIAITKLNDAPLESLLGRLNAPGGVTGFLVALLILSPEGAGACRSRVRNQVQRAMNICLGSVLATSALAGPVVVVIAQLTGQRLMLGLDVPSILLLITTFMVCQVSLTGGKTNAHSGSAHVALFMIYLMLLFT